MTSNPEQLLLDARHQAGQHLGPLLELYRGYLGVLARMEVGTRLHRKIDPSDLVQETLLDAYRQFSRFEGATEAQFLAWLRRILAGKAANTVRYYLGTQGRNIQHELEEELTESFNHVSGALGRLAVTSGTPSQNLMQREQSVLIADALQKLPDDYREVLMLRHWEDLTFPEITQHMNRTVGSVEKLWLRALEKLRKKAGLGTTP